MPLTRSASQKSLDRPSVSRDSAVLEDNFSTTATPLRRNKRSVVDGVQTPLRTPTPRKKAKTSVASPAVAPETPVKPIPAFELTDASLDPSRMIPGKLPFEFEDAKKHLISVDQRFEALFERLPCKPFENLEPVDPFRLFDPTLPEKAEDKTSEGWGASKTSFPSPEDVLTLDIPQLKSAGLSTRKAEYVLSLAEHFASGKLSAGFLQTASVEEVSKALIDIRGIGQWTVDMFLMFTLRRPDILPVGDLGVQKGMMKWVLAAYDKSKAERPINPANPFLDDDDVPQIPQDSGSPDISSVVPTVEPGSPEGALPTDNIVYQTESPAHAKEEHEAVKKTLISFPADKDPEVACPLPEGFTVDVLKSRISGKKVKYAKSGTWVISH
ncbi:hypothetical protein QFC22_005847 [Naganishia vaughanmartiniae]|uniref:Uncharacterized protein n=1 Tax=Naganishia vaughanmartiniae TaxID=1424756 RepID=A0ACC2WSL4_9TREE|nr:hypothetical protein QFC22_005847 [Naganishia vaughanmartiniae]